METVIWPSGKACQKQDAVNEEMLTYAKSAQAREVQNRVSNLV